MGGQAIREGVVLVGAVDWQRRLFDELVPIPRGTTDNADPVRGREKTVFIDSVDPSCWDALAGSLASLGVERLDHVVSNHAEQDHSGSLPKVLQGFPTATVLTTPKGKGMPKDLLQIPAVRLEHQHVASPPAAAQGIAGTLAREADALLHGHLAVEHRPLLALELPRQVQGTRASRQQRSATGTSRSTSHRRGGEGVEHRYGLPPVAHRLQPPGELLAAGRLDHGDEGGLPLQHHPRRHGRTFGEAAQHTRAGDAAAGHEDHHHGGESTAPPCHLPVTVACERGGVKRGGLWCIMGCRFSGQGDRMKGQRERAVQTLWMAAAVAVLLLAAPSSAQGLYVGAAYSWTGVDLAEGGVDWATFEENADGYKLVAGYRGDFFGIEGAWINFGSVDASQLEGFDEGWAEANTDAWSLAITAHLPLGSRLTATAKAGYYFWDSQVTGTQDFLDRWGEAARNGDDYFYGFGLLVSVTKHVGVVGEWEKYPAAGGFDFTMTSLGVRFSL